MAHLVLGKPRPKTKASGRRSKRSKPIEPVTLAPDIEVRVQMRERWSHKREGTPETHEHAAIEASRPGALARLVATGALDAHQLAAAEEIALAYQRTVADVTVRTAKWDARCSGGRRGELGAIEGVAAARLDLAYSAWRHDAGVHAAMLLAIIVDDIGLTATARASRMSVRRARTVLTTALDRWRRV